MNALDGFYTMILNILRIPPGAALRKNQASRNENATWATEALLKHDLVKTIVLITADDVCIGNSPIYYTSPEPLPEKIQKPLDLVVEELNSIVKWVAMDLLTLGYSLYRETKTEDGRLFLVPVLEEVKFFMDVSKNIDVISVKTGKPIENPLLFIYYEKSSLVQVEDESSDYLFQVNSIPIQVRNVTESASELWQIERAMLHYRKKLARMIRLVAVEVGMSQGDKQQEVIDSVASSINADSLSLTPVAENQDFDDTIPVVPMRKGIGKPEIIESKGGFDISEMKDLDHTLNKIHLALRFPKTYSDFSTSIGQTAASTIRGDVRYSRLLSTASSVIETRINKYLGESKTLTKLDVKAYLTKFPTVEDSDVLDAVDTTIDFLDSIKNLFEGLKTKEEADVMKEMLRIVLTSTTKLPVYAQIFEAIDKYIEVSFKDVDSNPDDPENNGFPDLTKGEEDIDFENTSGAPGEDLEPKIDEESSGEPTVSDIVVE